VNLFYVLFPSLPDEPMSRFSIGSFLWIAQSKALRPADTQSFALRLEFLHLGLASKIIIDRPTSIPLSSF
jgi:hypothetical protein